jgi:hypothetical protein
MRTVVVLDPNDAHHLSGSGKSEELLPSKPQLLELAYAAGISFTASKPLPTETENIVSWQVSGWVKNAMGDRLEDTATYTLDMRYKERPDPVDGSVLIRAMQDHLKKRTWNYSPSKRPKDMPPDDAPDEEWFQWARRKALREVRMIDRFRDQRAETGAKLRLIRNFCNLKSKYTRAQMSKPFEIARASFDVSRAMQVGGPFKEMAERLVMSMAASQFGIPAEEAVKLLPEGGTTVNDVDERMVRLTDEEAGELVEEMVEAGFADRSACDRKATDLYGLPVSSLTHHQADLLREQIELMEVAKGVLEKEDQKNFIVHMNNATRLASSELATITDVMEQGWYDKLYPPEEEEGPEGPEESVPIYSVPFFPGLSSEVKA